SASSPIRMTTTLSLDADVRARGRSGRRRAPAGGGTGRRPEGGPLTPGRQAQGVFRRHGRIRATIPQKQAKIKKPAIDTFSSLGFAFFWKKPPNGRSMKKEASRKAPRTPGRRAR